MPRIIRKITVLFLTILLVLPAQSFAQILPYMPPVGQMIMPANKPFDLPYIVGMRFSSEDIFKFTFILNRGDVEPREDLLRHHVDKVGKYFLAALTIPEKDIWVNLSPYEQNRIITPELGQTDLGKDLLGEDYVLKQLASSLTFPNSESGKKYWQAINNFVGAAPRGRPGQAQGPAPTQSFTKIWIVPGTIKIKESSDRVVINQAMLKVLTDEDYLAIQKNGVRANDYSPVNQSTKAMREIIVPLIEKEVNTGKHFAHLRQLYYSIIMASWFKKKLKDTILNEVYFNQKKVKGADVDDPEIKDKIYNEYVNAFKTGVYNVIRREFAGTGTGSPTRGSVYVPGAKIIKRQYFSGGFALGGETERAVASEEHGTTPELIADLRAAGQNRQGNGPFEADALGEAVLINTPRDRAKTQERADANSIAEEMYALVDRLIVKEEGQKGRLPGVELDTKPFENKIAQMIEGLSPSVISLLLDFHTIRAVDLRGTMGQPGLRNGYEVIISVLQEKYNKLAIEALKKQYPEIGRLPADAQAAIARAIGNTHDKAGGWRYLDQDDVKNNPDKELVEGATIKAWTEERNRHDNEIELGVEREAKITRCYDGRLIVTTGTIQENAVKLLNLIRAGLTKEQAKWMTDRGWVGSDKTPGNGAGQAGALSGGEHITLGVGVEKAGKIIDGQSIVYINFPQAETQHGSSYNRTNYDTAQYGISGEGKEFVSIHDPSRLRDPKTNQGQRSLYMNVNRVGDRPGYYGKTTVTISDTPGGNCGYVEIRYHGKGEALIINRIQGKDQPCTVYMGDFAPNAADAEALAKVAKARAKVSPAFKTAQEAINVIIRDKDGRYFFGRSIDQAFKDAIVAAAGPTGNLTNRELYALYLRSRARESYSREHHETRTADIYAAVCDALRSKFVYISDREESNGFVRYDSEAIPTNLGVWKVICIRGTSLEIEHNGQKIVDLFGDSKGEGLNYEELEALKAYLISRSRQVPSQQLGEELLNATAKGFDGFRVLGRGFEQDGLYPVLVVPEIDVPAQAGVTDHAQTTPSSTSRSDLALMRVREVLRYGDYSDGLMSSEIEAAALRLPRDILQHLRSNADTAAKAFLGEIDLGNYDGLQRRGLSLDIINRYKVLMSQPRRDFLYIQARLAQEILRYYIISEVERITTVGQATGQTAKGGFDFADTQDASDVDMANGGLKLSRAKAADSLSRGKVAGFKLAILALRY